MTDYLSLWDAYWVCDPAASNAGYGEWCARIAAEFADLLDALGHVREATYARCGGNLPSLNVRLPDGSGLSFNEWLTARALGNYRTRFPDIAAMWAPPSAFHNLADVRTWHCVPGGRFVWEPMEHLVRAGIAPADHAGDRLYEVFRRSPYGGEESKVGEYRAKSAEGAVEAHTFAADTRPGDVANFLARPARLEIPG